MRKSCRSFLVLTLGSALLVLMSFGCSESSEPGNDGDLLGTCPAPTTAGPVLGNGAYAVVVNSLSEEWVVFNLDTGTLLPTRGLTGRSPNDVDVIQNRLYFTNSLDNSIQVVSTETGEETGCITLGAGCNPWAFAVDEANPEIGYSTCFLSGDLREVDVTNEDVVRSLDLGPGIEGLLVTPQYVWVTQTAFNGAEGDYGQGEVLLVDRSNWEVASRIPVPTNPQFLLKVGDFVDVICTGNYGTQPNPTFGKVARIDMSTLQVSDTLELGGSPVEAATGPVNHVYVAAQAGGILSYDSTTFSLVHGTQNPLEGTGGYSGVAFHGDILLVTNFNLDALVGFDLGNGELLVHETIVGDGPVSVFVLP